MKLNKVIAVPAIALAAGLGLAACGQAATPHAAPAPTHTVTAPAATPKPTTPAPTTPAPAPAKTVYVQAPAAPAAPPAPADNYPAGAFLTSQSVSDSLANEQQTELSAAPSYDYYSPGNISVSVYCTGTGVYNCTASDTDGDTGYGDVVTVIDGGNAWSDTGMNWTGPDVYVDGGATNYWTTPAQSDWTNT